jgi:hypothetical protein
MSVSDLYTVGSIECLFLISLQLARLDASFCFLYSWLDWMSVSDFFTVGSIGCQFLISLHLARLDVSF